MLCKQPIGGDTPWCEDDMNGDLVPWGGCAGILAAFLEAGVPLGSACDTDLSTLPDSGPDIPMGEFLHVMCPASCEVCN